MTLWPHGLQYARLLCPPITPRFCSNSCPLSQWCYATISSSVALFSFCFQSSPASVSFPTFVSSHQVAKYCSFSFSIRTLKSQHHSSKASILWHSAFFMVQNSPYVTAGKTSFDKTSYDKNIALTMHTDLCQQSNVYNVLSRFVIAFLPRTKCLLISWL